MLGVAGSVTNSCDITHKLVSNQGSAIFDGTNDFIDASSVASNLSMTTGTVSLWARITTTSNNESFFNCSDGESGDNKFSIFYLTSSGILRGNYKFGGTAVNVDHSIGNDDIVGAGWFHVALTYDTSANSLILYFNGSAVATSTTSLTAINTDSVTIDRVYLGKNSNADNTFHQGYIDEYAYFARVLTASEISDIHAAKGLFNYAEDLSLTGTNNQLKQWLRFGDGSAGGLNDVTTGIIDMSNATLGSDVITNGDFNGNADNWTLTNAEYQASGNNVILTKPSSGNSSIFQTSLSFQEGQILRYKFKFVSFTGSPFIRIDGFSGSNPLNTSTSFAASGGDVDTYVKTDRAGTSVFLYIVGGSVGDTVVIDDVSVQIVQGNPAFVSGALINQNNLPG